MNEWEQLKSQIASAPQAHKAIRKGKLIAMCKAIGKMVVGPPKSVIRNRLQTKLAHVCTERSLDDVLGGGLMQGSHIPQPIRQRVVVLELKGDFLH